MAKNRRKGIGSQLLGDARPHENLRPNSGSARSHDVIARRAYEIYLARGGAPGRDLDDWLQAEREFGAPMGADLVSLASEKDNADGKRSGRVRSALRLPARRSIAGRHAASVATDAEGRG
jgi:hypothetical protein